jgi:hypothetical protein
MTCYWLDVQAYLSRIVNIKWYYRFLHYEQYDIDVSVSQYNLELYLTIYLSLRFI